MMKIIFCKKIIEDIKIAFNIIIYLNDKTSKLIKNMKLTIVLFLKIKNLENSDLNITEYSQNK